MALKLYRKKDQLTGIVCDLPVSFRYVSTVILNFLLILLAGLSCRKDTTIIPSEKEKVPQLTTGFYLLNEGSMGRNNATLDYYDVQTSVYHSNIYAETNPGVVKQLGDVGNDLKIHGGKLYAVMNCSNLVEVMNVADAKHIAKFDVLNGRYITFHDDKAYVSSYAGPVQLGDKRLGVVLEFDTVNFRETRRVTVGYQPEEMAIVNGKLYVANSGGYTATDYDRTVSVVDLATFKEIKKIDVDVNLHRVKADDDGDIYVNSRGDHYGQGSKLHVIDTKTDVVKKTIDVSVSNFCIVGDTVYMYGSDFDHTTGKTTIAYSLLNVKTQTILPGSFITDGTDTVVERPYGIAVDPVSRDVYITDARNYTVSGKLYCFDRQGKMKLSHTTGYIPAHIAFVTK